MLAGTLGSALWLSVLLACGSGNLPWQKKTWSCFRERLASRLQAASKPLPFFVCKWGGSRFQAASKLCKWKQLGSSSCKWKRLESSSYEMEADRKHIEESGFHIEMGAAWKQLGSGFHTESCFQALPGLLEPLSFWKFFCHGISIGISYVISIRLQTLLVMTKTKTIIDVWGISVTLNILILTLYRHRAYS